MAKINKIIYPILSLCVISLSTRSVKSENIDRTNQCLTSNPNCSLLKIAQTDVRQQIYSLREQSFVARKERNFRRAIALMEQVLQLAQQAKDLDAEWWARNDLAETYKDSGDLPKALALHQQNLAFVRQNSGYFETRPFSQVTQNLIYLSKVYTLQKNYPKAIELLREAIAIEQKLNSPNTSAVMATVLKELGINLFLSGNAKDGETNLLNAAQTFENARQAKTLAWAVGQQYEFEIELKRWLQQILIGQNRTNEALELAEQNRAREFVGLLVNRLNINSGNQQSIEAPNLEQIKQIAKAKNATIVQYTVAYDYNTNWQLTYTNEEQIRANNLFIWVIKPTGQIIFRRQPLNGQKIPLPELVRQAREAMGVRGLSVVARVEPTPSATPQRSIDYLRQLHQLLIQPIADLLPANPNDRVVFIPQDFLFLVPFAALKDVKGNYLISQHTVVLSPSIQVLDITRKEQQQIPNSVDGVLIVGNPTMPQSLPKLPGSEREANAIAQLFNAQPLIGDRATKAAVLQRLSSARIIHFATHGLLDDVFGAFSSLALAPTDRDNGFFKAREIISLKMNAELVVLSACNTGRGKINGDGVLGLSRSFLAAGVPSVIVSLWAVPDAPTAALMTNFYGEIKQGADKAQALRQAMLKTMKSYPAPVNWAAFTLMGEANSSPQLQAAKGDASVSTQAAVRNYHTALPVPDNVSNYFELPSQQIEGQIDISFKTNLSIEELVKFYRQEFQNRGLPENDRLANIRSNGFQLVFVDASNRRNVVIQANGFDPNLMQVFVRLERMRPSGRLPSF